MTIGINKNCQRETMCQGDGYQITPGYDPGARTNEYQRERADQLGQKHFRIKHTFSFY
jgi:hypothetical protein